MDATLKSYSRIFELSSKLAGIPGIESQAIVTSGETEYYLTLLSWSDYHGSDVDRANARFLVKTYGETAFEQDWGPQGFEALRIGDPRQGCQPFPDLAFPDGAEATARRLEDLIETFTELQDYGLLSEETHAQLVQEMAEEAWSSWLSWDIYVLLSALAEEQEDSDAASLAVDEYHEEAERLSEVVYAVIEASGGWYCTAATAANFSDTVHTVAVRTAAILFPDWALELDSEDDRVITEVQRKLS